MKRLRFLIPLTVAALIAVFAFAPASYAACPAQQAYSNSGGNSQVDVNGASQGSDCKNIAGVDNGNGPGASANTPQQAANTPGTSNNTDASGSLPFTGLDLAMVVGAGLLLTGLGVTLRRISTQRPGH